MRIKVQAREDESVAIEFEAVGWQPEEATQGPATLVIIASLEIVLSLQGFTDD